MKSATARTHWFAKTAARRLDVKRPDGVRAFHVTVPGYAPTPLIEAPALAAELGVARVLVKQESDRFGLPSFKALGASWASARALIRHLGGEHIADQLTWELLRDLAERTPDLELVAATDGNHGRAVARVAAMLGWRSRMFVPRGLPDTVVSAIAGEGSEVIETGAKYNDAVTVADRYAQQTTNAILIQDMGWDGYEDVPQWVVDGYSTLFAEIDDQLAELGVDVPDLIVVPTGVGSVAQACITHHRAGERPGPAILLAQSDAAPAVVLSLQRGAITSSGESTTIMHGLNCQLPSSLAWPLIAEGVDAAVAVSDAAAIEAVTSLQDAGIDTGPCGAATLAAVRAAAEVSSASQRQALALDRASVVLLISTEGASANPVPDSLRPPNNAVPPDLTPSTTHRDDGENDED